MKSPLPLLRLTLALGLLSPLMPLAPLALAQGSAQRMPQI